MLQRLTIRNFQCHQSLILDFDKYLTVLCGASDTGKSAILRSLRWICCNRPSGTSFIRHGTDRVRVVLQVAGATITRDRGPNSNVYRVTQVQGRDRSCRVFRALGSQVPDAVASLLNISEVSWQGQHGPPFWFADSPGQVSKNLNQIVALDLIDRTLANLATEQRRSKTVVEVSRQRLKTASEHRNRLSWVQSIDVQLKKLEEQEQEITQNRSRITWIDQMLADVQKYAKQRQHAARTLESLSNCIRTGEELVAQQQKVDGVQQLLDRCIKLQGDVCQARERKVQVEAGLKKVMKGRCPVCRQLFPELKRK